MAREKLLQSKAVRHRLFVRKFEDNREINIINPIYKFCKGVNGEREFQYRISDGKDW